MNSGHSDVEAFLIWSPSRLRARSPLTNWNLGQIYIPAYGEPTRRENVKFLILVSGVILDTGSSFISTHEYSTVADLLFGHYQEIGADYEKDPRTWSGWSNFDGGSEMYVFGYASLTSPPP